MGLLSGIFDIFQGMKQNSEAGKINPVYNPYQVSPYAQTTLANAQNAYNGRMAGAGYLEQNIQGNAANTVANAQKNAESGAQALAVDAAAQGQANAADRNLQAQEAQNKYGMLNNLNMANSGMTNELDKQYQAMLQKYMMDVQQQSALRSAGATNIAQGLGGIESSAELGMSAASKGSGSGGGGGMLGSVLGSII